MKLVGLETKYRLAAFKVEQFRSFGGGIIQVSAGIGEQISSET